MIHIAADKLLRSKHAHAALPLAPGGVPFALPDLTEIVAGGTGEAKTGMRFRQEDAGPGSDLPLPDPTLPTADPALLALFSPPPTMPSAIQPEEPVATPTAMPVGAAMPGPSVEAVPADGVLAPSVAPPVQVDARPTATTFTAPALPDAAPPAASREDATPTLLTVAPLLTTAPSIPAITLPAASPGATDAAVTAMPSPTPDAEPVAAPARPAEPAMIAPGGRTPLHFAVSAELAAAFDRITRADSLPVVPAAAPAPGREMPTAAIDAPVPLPSHWHVPPALRTRGEPAAAAPVATASALPVIGTPPRQPAVRDERGGIFGLPVAATTAVAPAPAIAPVPEAAVIDLGREQWPADMIVEIERLRDAADAADTRIRLLPDALGDVQVDVRRDGDVLSVRFTADQPQTRALLQEAQPRLAEAAEARGLRLGQSSVDAGSHGQHRQPAANSAPQRAATSTSVDDRQAPADDARIA